jgi:two-component system sensor histidine kinase/response regulator
MAWSCEAAGGGRVGRPAGFSIAFKRLENWACTGGVHQMDEETKVSLLLVDDHPENLVALRAILDGLGQNNVSAGSGLEALRCVLHQDFAAILLDVKMPGMDGFEAATLIRSREASKSVPIIFMTSHSPDDTQVFRGYALGAVDFLFKPLHPEVLKSKVAVFIDLHRKNEELRRQTERLVAGEQEAHRRELTRVKQAWEAERLHQEMLREQLVTAQLQESYDRLREVETLRDDVTHMIIHDLRTPLSSLITGLLTIDTLGSLNSIQRELLEIAANGGNTLLRMIDDLLDISKMEAGSLSLDLEQVRVADLVASAIEQVAWLAEEKGLSVDVEVPDDAPGFAGDVEKLRRTLVNLLGNAHKFTPQGGKIQVLVRVAEDTRQLTFGVRDSGEGIPKAAFARIFEKFGQVEDRQGGRGMSTGLGLAFCKMAVEAHGGSIWVESELGTGSTFWFTIPQKDLPVPCRDALPVAA